MHDRARSVLMLYAMFLFACGLTGFALSGFSRKVCACLPASLSPCLPACLPLPVCLLPLPACLPACLPLLHAHISVIVRMSMSIVDDDPDACWQRPTLLFVVWSSK